jgi:hypothetical protein
METTMEAKPAATAASKKQMPRTREEFRLAAIWLARKAAAAGNEVCEWLWPPSDPDMGVCRGYLDGRDGR